MATYQIIMSVICECLPIRTLAEKTIEKRHWEINTGKSINQTEEDK